MAKLKYTAIDATSSANADRVNESSKIKYGDDGNNTTKDVGYIPQNFIDADKLLSSINIASDKGFKQYDDKITLTFGSNGSSGIIKVKFVKVGTAIMIYADTNGRAPVSEALKSYTDVGDHKLKKNLRPIVPVVVQTIYLGEIDKGFTGSIGVQQGQFIQINPDGTIDVKISGVSIFQAFSSRTRFYLISDLWESQEV